MTRWKEIDNYSMFCFLKMVIYISIAASLIMLMKKMLKTKLSPKLNFCMWILLLGAFLVPIMPKTRFSIYNFISITNIEKYIRRPVILNNEMLNLLIQGDSIKVGGEDSVFGAIEFLNDGTDEIKLNLSHDGIAMIIYCGITSIFFMYFVVMYIVFRVKIANAPKVTEKTIFVLVDKFKETLGISKDIRIAYGQSAMLVGVIKPLIIMPENSGEEELKYILLHELCHYRNKDNLYILLSVVILLFNWFNPIIWLAFFTFRKDVEIYCDFRVVELNCVNKKDYAKLLLNITLKKNKFTFGTTLLQNSKNEIKARINFLGSYNEKHPQKTPVAYILISLTTIVCLTNGIESSEDKFNNNVEEVGEDSYIKEFVDIFGNENDYVNQIQPCACNIDESEIVKSYLSENTKLEYANGYFLQEYVDLYSVIQQKVHIHEFISYDYLGGSYLYYLNNKKENRDLQKVFTRIIMDADTNEVIKTERIAKGKK